MTNADQPAFPKSIDDTGMGLTKREYFAAMAMQGLLANSEVDISYEALSLQSISQADELLRQLETPK